MLKMNNGLTFWNYFFVGLTLLVMTSSFTNNIFFLFLKHFSCFQVDLIIQKLNWKPQNVKFLKSFSLHWFDGKTLDLIAPLNLFVFWYNKQPCNSQYTQFQVLYSGVESLILSWLFNKMIPKGNKK